MKWDEAVLLVLFTVATGLGILVLLWVLHRLNRLEYKFRRLVDVLYEANRVLHPDKLVEMQDLLRRVGENGDR